MFCSKKKLQKTGCFVWTLQNFFPISIIIRSYFRLENLPFFDNAMISIRNFFFTVNLFILCLCLKTFSSNRQKISSHPVLAKIFYNVLNQESISFFISWAWSAVILEYQGFLLFYGLISIHLKMRENLFKEE